MCEPKNPESIARTVRRIMELSHEEKHTIKLAAKRMVEQTYTWERISADMRKVFETLVQ